MYDERIIDGIKISRPADRFGRYSIENTLTGAYFTINKSKINSEGEPIVFYLDSFDNIMSNNKQLKVIIEGNEVMHFKEYRSRVNFSKKYGSYRYIRVDLEILDRLLKGTIKSLKELSNLVDEKNMKNNYDDSLFIYTVLYYTKKQEEIDKFITYIDSIFIN